MLQLPDFPWDTLAAAKQRAAGHPGGIVDLSVGTPVDDTPPFARDALAAASNAHGYPTVWGTHSCRQAIVDYMERRWDVSGLTHESVMTVVGTKELVALFPFLLGLGPGDAVVFPEQAYPTYAVGALAVGAEAIACDDPGRIPTHTKLIWINSPGNPTGRVLTCDEQRAFVTKAREVGAILASDECYGDFVWEGPAARCVLDGEISDTLDGLLAVQSVSKRSNAAGFRAGFVVGDPRIVQGLVSLRKHLGLMVSTPVQAALAALLSDESHVTEQAARYRARRDQLRRALLAAGFRIDHSQGSLYLWASRDEDCRATVDWFAERGILVAPGDFYGTAAARHVRVALTASDERIAAAVDRLTADR